MVKKKKQYVKTEIFMIKQVKNRMVNLKNKI